MLEIETEKVVKSRVVKRKSVDDKGEGKKQKLMKVGENTKQKENEDEKDKEVKQNERRTLTRKKNP